MGSRRSFATEGGSCEDWYGKGDGRCPSTYGTFDETKAYWNWSGSVYLSPPPPNTLENLQTEIKLIEKEVAHYQYIVAGKHLQTAYTKFFSRLLKQKQGELKIAHEAQEKKQDQIRLAQEKIKKEQELFLARIREEIIRTTAKPKTVVVDTPPEYIDQTLEYSPLIIGGVVVVVIILFLRRRA